MRGIPVRIELGPKDIEAGSGRDRHAGIPVRRSTANIDELAEKVAEVTGDGCSRICWSVQEQHRENHTYDAVTIWKNSIQIADEKPGFIQRDVVRLSGVRGRDQGADFGVTSRCIPFKQVKLSDTCVYCGKPATKMVYWGKAY